MAADRREIPTSDLLFDEQNPRLRDAGSSQRDAMLKIAKAQGPKLIGLAAHIAANGLNPGEAFLVVPEGKKYRVLDGNRRLSAIRALDTPDALAAVLPPSRIKRLKDLNAAAQIPGAAWCAVFDTEAEAEPFVSNKHLGSAAGAGLEKWSGEQKRRHEERIGRAKAPEIQVLDFVRDAGTLNPTAQALAESGDFPLAMLVRLVEGAGARAAAGLGGLDATGAITRLHPGPELLKPLTQFIQDIADKKISTRTHGKVEELAQYFRDLAPDVRPEPRSRLAAPEPLGSGLAASAGAGRKPTRRRDRKASTDRPNLIPTTTDLDIPVARVHDMYLELKKLPVDEFWNAGGATLRVFVELSITSYLKKYKLPIPAKDRWRPNWNTAKAHMHDNGVLDGQTLNKVEQAIFDTNTGFVGLNAIVHDHEYTYTGNDLKGLWGRLEPLLRAIWPR